MDYKKINSKIKEAKRITVSIKFVDSLYKR